MTAAGKTAAGKRQALTRSTLRDFPYLEPDDIKAAWEYAAAQAGHLVIKSA